MNCINSGKTTASRVKNQVIGIFTALLLTYSCAINAQNDASAELSESAIAQIQALVAEKDARSPAQQKIDSQLIYAARGHSRQPIAAGVPTLATGIEVDARGEVAIEIRASYSAELATKLKNLGVSVIRHSERAQSIEALAPIARLEAIASEPSVRFIMPQLRGMLAGSTELKMTPRLSRFKAKVVEALAAHNPVRAKIGTANSQGDAAHRAIETRARFGVNGAGLRIGVLSDSFNNLGTANADVTSGDLPGPTNPNGYLTPVRLAGTGDLGSGGSDEGRAMLQIVHDLAPGAELYYAEAFSSFANFAENIRALRGISASPGAFGNVSPGCDIIIDDIFYFVETGLHDGQPAPSNFNMAIVTQAVNDVVANGALYFSSAGNSGSVQQGTSGAWEGNFVTGTRPAIITGTGDALAWNGVDVGNTLTGTNAVTMQWSDPLGSSNNDYDLFRLNATLTAIVVASTNVQSGTQDPFEQVTGASSTRLVVVRRTGAAARFISLSTNRGRLQYGTTGQTRGHGASPNAFGVAATPAAATGGAPTPTGPFPSAFVSTNQIENFSSDGPRRSFFDAAGTAYTPSLLAAGGILRQKPDFTAADGVATTLPGASGLNPFYGTSAAAPHAGAIAALIKQGSPASTNLQITNFLTSTALDIMAVGSDAGSGVGILQAFQAVSATGAVPRAVLTLNTVTLPTGNGAIDPNDCNVINVSLNNTSQVGATAISATLSSSTPGITINQGFSIYPTLNAASGGSNSTPFRVSSASSLVGGSLINFTLTVNYSGGNSPQIFTFTRTAGGAPNYAFTASAGATIPAGAAVFAGSNVDDAEFTFTSPFPITAYGSVVGTSVRVDTNGNVSLSGAGGSNFTNTALPGALPASVAYTAYWDDLDLIVTGGGIAAFTTGASPNRRLFIEWRGETFGTTTSTITTNVALVLIEGSSVFEYHYATVGGTNAGGQSATIGVQDSASGRFTQFSFNTASVTAGTVLTGNLVPGASGTGTCPVSTTAISSITPAGNQSVGVPYTVNVNVSGASPTGTVLVMDDTGASCTVTLPGTSCLLTSTQAGARTITARYSGDANNGGSNATAPITVVNNRQGLQVGSVTLPATTTSNAITRINFAQAFNQVPVVIVQPSNADTDPQAVRIFNVSRTGFNALQVEARGTGVGCTSCTGTGVAMDVHWLAATPGSYFLRATNTRGSGGVLVKAGTISTSANQRGPTGFTGWPIASFQPVVFPAGDAFTGTPVVLTTLQTWSPANEGLNLNISAPNLTGTSQVWATTVTSAVSATGFNVAIESSEVNDDDVGALGLDRPETIGFVAIEGNTSGVIAQLGGGTVGIGTNSASNNVTSTCTDVDVNMPGSIAISGPNLRGFAGKQSRNETDGGWLRRCTFASPGGVVARMGVRVDEDADLDTERLHAAESVGAAIFSGEFTNTPVSLAQLSARRIGDTLAVQFASATEIGHLGYRIWGRTDPDADWQALHDDLIIGDSSDGFAGKSYQHSVSGLTAGNLVQELRIEDVDILGQSRFQAGVKVGESVGTPAVFASLNWAALRAANRNVQPRTARSSSTKAILDVTTSGVQRIYFEDVQPFGFAPGIPSAQLALSDAGIAIARFDSCANFGPGCYLEFLGSARTSLYGSANAYTLSVGPNKQNPVNAGALIDLPGTVKIVEATLEQMPNRSYSFSAPGSDPWFDQRLSASTAPTSLVRSFSLPSRSAGKVTLSVMLWGGLNYPGDVPDHSVELWLNGSLLRALRFDGLSAQTITEVVPEALLLAQNTLTLKLPADTGYSADVVLLDGFTVRYPRRASANSGELKFGTVSAANGSDSLFADRFEPASGSAFELTGISAASVLWSERGGVLYRDVISADTNVNAETSALVLSAESVIAKPAAREFADATLDLSPTDYLIVTNPLFEAELAPLVALQQSRGYSVRVLRSDQIYSQFSDAEADPEAIRSTIAAIKPRFVLLVGGDSYDYHDYLGLGSVSFIPTFYHAADQIVRFAASDLRFVDQDQNGAPESALGRIPARSIAELRLALSSIIARANSPARSYLAVAGGSSASQNFSLHSVTLLSYLRQNQPKQFALVDELGTNTARAAATAGLAGGADWLNYLGHSSPNRWGFENVLDTSQLSSISRTGLPAIVSQWGCWNNYFVLPNQDTMAHALMLRPNQLAAAVIGSSSLAEDASHLALGTRFFDLVEDGRIGDAGNAPINTIGEALRAAKQDLMFGAPEHVESNYSISLFGDPAMPLR